MGIAFGVWYGKLALSKLKSKFMATYLHFYRQRTLSNTFIFIIWYKVIPYGFSRTWTISSDTKIYIKPFRLSMWVEFLMAKRLNLAGNYVNCRILYHQSNWVSLYHKIDKVTRQWKWEDLLCQQKSNAIAWKIIPTTQDDSNDGISNWTWRLLWDCIIMIILNFSQHAQWTANFLSCLDNPSFTFFFIYIISNKKAMAFYPTNCSFVYIFSSFHAMKKKRILPLIWNWITLMQLFSLETSLERLRRGREIIRKSSSHLTQSIFILSLFIWLLSFLNDI